MTKSAYVVMSTFHSQIFIPIPTPKFFCSSLKQAKALVKAHNENPRTTTEYYIRKVKVLHAD